MIHLDGLNGTSSSSATIWPIATNRPWPMSILPKKAETVPSALIGDVGGRAGPASAAAWRPARSAALIASTVSRPIGVPTDTTSAPPPCSIARRENAEACSILVMALSLNPSSSAARLTARMMPMCVPHRHLSPSSACLISASVGFFCRRRKRGGGHDPAVDAVAALRHLLLDIGGLQRVRLLRRAEARQRHDLGVAAADTGVTQERTGWPSRCTVQAPHCASPQPKCGLFRPRSLRSA